MESTQFFIFVNPRNPLYAPYNEKTHSAELCRVYLHGADWNKRSVSRESGNITCLNPNVPVNCSSFWPNVPVNFGQLEQTLLIVYKGLRVFVPIVPVFQKKYTLGRKRGGGAESAASPPHKNFQHPILSFHWNNWNNWNICMFHIYIYLKKDNNNKGLQSGTPLQIRPGFCSSAETPTGTIGTNL